MNARLNVSDSLGSSVEFRGYKQILKNYTQKSDFLAEVETQILKGVAALIGDEKADLVKREGIQYLHKYLRPEFLPFLNRFLTDHLRDRVLQQCASIGYEELGLTDFFVDETVIFRLHFPHYISRTSKLTRAQYLALDLKKIETAEEQLQAVSARTDFKPYSAGDLSKMKYHRNLPDAAYAHGPHRDTWFGHTFGAVNLWWSIRSVTKKNGLILFERDNQVDLAHLPAPAYLAPDQPISEPDILSLDDGDLLVFDPEILHATRLNTGEETRIVITGRINPRQPLFYAGTSEAEYPYWLKGADALNGRTDQVLQFWRKDNSVSRPDIKLTPPRPRRPVVEVMKHYEKGIRVDIAREILVTSELFKVVFSDRSVVVINLSGKLYAMASACPHVGIDLIDGYLKDGELICPGHGVPFNCETGKSDCRYFAVKTYAVSVDGDALIFEP